MQWIADFFSKLLKRIADLWTLLGNLVQAILNTIAALGHLIVDTFIQIFVDAWEILTDLPVWVFDALLDLVVTIVAAFDFSGITQSLGAFGQLPAEIINMLGYCGVGEALGIIAAALVVRMLLQLIPFVRLGS